MRAGSAFFPKLDFPFLTSEPWVERLTLTSSHPLRDPAPISIKLGCLLFSPAKTRKTLGPGWQKLKAVELCTRAPINSERGIENRTRSCIVEPNFGIALSSRVYKVHHWLECHKFKPWTQSPSRSGQLVLGHLGWLVLRHPAVSHKGLRNTVLEFSCSRRRHGPNMGGANPQP